MLQLRALQCLSPALAPALYIAQPHIAGAAVPRARVVECRPKHEPTRATFSEARGRNTQPVPAYVVALGPACQDIIRR
eukprot:1058732-Alexandrium_andersonii.AAC.1